MASQLVICTAPLDRWAVAIEDIDKSKSRVHLS